MFPTSGGCDTKVTFFVIALNVNKLLSCDLLRIYAPLQVSCHLTRSVNIHRTVCHNPFYNKLFHDCAPYATYFVRPTEAYKTTLYKIYYFKTIIPNAVFWSEHRKGVLLHTALGELPSHAKREYTYGNLS